MSIAPPTLPHCTQELFKLEPIEKATFDDVCKAGELVEATTFHYSKGGDGTPTRANVVDAQFYQRRVEDNYLNHQYPDDKTARAVEEATAAMREILDEAMAGLNKGLDDVNSDVTRLREDITKLRQNVSELQTLPKKLEELSTSLGRFGIPLAKVC
ncbi:hypothetical protein FS837_001946 [Tulasnella sp. UAMH 9824]|nr:hypothetical protein FS837_001946 [Tulasnella sp. UAMH 9824]